MDRKKLMVHLVLGAGDLHVSQVLAHDLADDATDVAHLLGVGCISEEVVAEYAAVAVRAEDRIVSVEVGNGPHEFMGDVVLERHVYELLVVQELVEVPEDPLQEQKGIEVFVSPPRRFIKHSEALLWHLVISHVEETRVELWLVQVENCLASICPLQLSKMLLC